MFEAFIHNCKVDLPPYNYVIQAAQELGLLLKDGDVRSAFEERFPLWAKAIVSCRKKTQIKSSAIQSETVGYYDEMEPRKSLSFLS